MRSERRGTTTSGARPLSSVHHQDVATRGCEVNGSPRRHFAAHWGAGALFSLDTLLC